MGDSSVDLGDSNFSNGIMIDSDEFELMSDEASGDILVTKATSGEFDGVFEDEIVFDSVNLEYVDVYDDAEISSMIINEDTDWDADDFEMNNDGVIDNLEIYIEGDITGSGVIKKLSAYENLTLVKSPTVSMYVDKNTTVKIGSSTFSGGSSGRTFSSGEMGYVGGDGKYLNTNTSYYRLSGGEHKVSEWLNGASIERITTGSGSILTSGTYGHWFLSGGYLRFYEYYMQTLPTGESKFIVYLTNGDSQAFYVTVYASGSTSWQGKYLETNTSYAKNSNTDHTVPTWLDYYTISKIENQSGVVLSSSDWYTSGSSLYFRRSYLDGLAYGSYRFRVYVNSGDYQDIYLDVSQYGSTTVGRYFTATTYYAKNTSSEHVVPATNSGYSVSRIANSAGSTISAAYYYYSGGYLRFTVAYMQSLAIGTTRLSVYMSNGDYQDIYIVVSQEGASGSGNYFNTNTTYNRTTGGNHDVLHWIGSTRTVSRIENENSVVLTQNSAYTVGGTYLTFYNSYMQALAVGQRRFRVYLSDGYYQDIYITVTTNTSSSVQYDLNPSGSQHTDLVLQGVTGLYNGGVMFNGVYLNSSAYSYDVSARTVRIWSSILAGYSVGTYTVRLGSGGTLYYTISVVDTRTTGTTYTYDLNPYGAQHTTVRMYAPSASALYVNNSSRGSTYWYVSSDGYVTLLLLDSYAVGTYNIGISGSSGQWYTYTLGIVDTRTSGNSGTLIWDKSSNGVKNNTVTGLPGLSYVSLNGSVLGSGYYSYTSGILTVVSTYLNSLAVGEYTLVVNTGIDIRTYTLNVVNIPANGADSRIVVVYDRYSLGSQHITPKFYAPGTTDMTLNGGVVNRSSWGLGSDGYVSYLLASSLGIGEYQVNLIGNSTVTWYYTLKIVDTSY
jgi:hypothetical protein